MAKVDRRLFGIGILVVAGAFACGGENPSTDGGPPEGDAGLQCSTTQTDCGGICVTTDTDNSNCGACGTSCAAGQVCDGAGVCATTCGTGLTECSGGCLDTVHNPSHCGGCGMACAAGEACEQSACVRIDECESPGDPSAAGVTLGAVDGPAVEGGASASYTVVLDSAPCTHVSVAIAGDAQVGAETSTLVFTPDNWDQPQSVAAVAVHDFDMEGDHSGVLTHAAVSGDSNYGAIAIGDASIAIEDRAHVTHVSVSTAGGGANGGSRQGRVSADGRWVAFISDATNLAPGDSGAFGDVFLRDMMNGTTERITEGLAGVEADASTSSVQISQDGALVAFASAASNLVDDENAAGVDIFAWSEAEGIRLVSTACAACSNLELSNEFGLAADGSAIAYSTRRQMVPGDPETEYDVYTFSLSDGALSHDSLNTAGENGAYFWGSNAFTPRLSSDGRYLGFTSAARNLDVPEITVQNFHSYLKDRVDGTLTRVSRHDGGNEACDGTHQATANNSPYISTDGQLAIFESQCAFNLGDGETVDANGTWDVFVRDLSAMTTTRITVGHDGTDADGPSVADGISANGRYVLFRSAASNLVADDTNDGMDVFVHDRTTGVTTRVNYDETYGAPARGLTISPRDYGAISSNGDFVVYTSNARTSSSDDNDFRDIYRVQLR